MRIQMNAHSFELELVTNQFYMEKEFVHSGCMASANNSKQLLSPSIL